ncbi:hypothetical protein MSAN_02070500 [Mycena sanguinolenta]|uniref:Uncharacterized protein n=1 Tax=Mycena sanguinolenta TaxID=230812 RepID=A0A8H6XJZ2_9AGAR|nr:hypothetical protein MSAN_02070500 [Mycena sanguinolenta]
MLVLEIFPDPRDEVILEGLPSDDSGDGADSDSSQESEQYAAGPEDDSSEESELEPDESEEGEALNKKKKSKKPSVSRSDILASRKTRDASGTPAVQAGTKRKAVKAKNGGKAKKTKSDQKKSGLIVSKPKAQAQITEDDSMVAPGGPALDDDTKEHVERPRTGKKSKGMPTALIASAKSLIVVQPAPPKALTRKQARGGTTKWTLKHLPENTSDQFTDEVVPLARELVGSDQVKPWSKLTVPQIQGIVDKVFGKGCHEVKPDGPWVGLVNYRLDSWRNGLGSQPHKYMMELIDSYESSDEDDEEMVEVTDSAGATTTVITARPRKFKFSTSEGVAAFVEWCLGSHAASPGTMAFHWKTWGNGIEKKGFLQSHLILYTFAYHLTCLEAIPGAYGRLEGYPRSALLMAEQAVHHELKFWRTGQYINPNKPANYFSADNCDDIIEIVQTANGKKKKLTRRATKFLAKVETWDNNRWKEVIDAAKDFMEVRVGRKRSKTVSCSSSEVEEDAILEDDDVIVLSD